jgi:hypothetical protein
MAGFNFENEENERILINKIGNVWNYYPKDFKIMFSGSGELQLFGEHNYKNKIYTSTDFCEWLENIIELKESSFELSERGKQIYIAQMKENPLKKAMYKKLIAQAELEIEREQNFIVDLKQLIKDIKEFSV